MTNEKVIAIIERYEARLREDGFEPIKMDVDEEIDLADITPALHHTHWMCGEIKQYLADGRTEKAMRWFGFVQGVLWLSGTFTVGELMEHNKPAGEKFDPAA